MIKSENGITFFLLIVTVIVLVIIGTAAAASGISTYKNAQVKLYLKEMDAIKEKVGLYEEKAGVNPDLDLATIGLDVTESDEAVDLLKKLGIGEDEYSNYRYLSSGAIKSELGLENISKSVVINVNTKKIYSITPAKYDNNLYYSADDLRNSFK